MVIFFNLIFKSLLRIFRCTDMDGSFVDFEHRPDQRLKTGIVPVRMKVVKNDVAPAR